MGEVARVQKYENLGNHHLAAADRALKQLTIPNSPKLKFFDAINLWAKAGKCFGIAEEWEESATAYMRAAKYMGRMDCPHESAVYWLKSGDMARRADPISAIEKYEQALLAYVEIGRMFTAGNICATIAEVYEEIREFKLSAATARRAADFYAAEHYTAQSSHCLMKAAMVMALSEDFEGACFAFAHVAESYQRSNLLRPNLPSVLLRAGLCLIADGGPIQGGLYTHTLLKFYMRKWSILDYAWEYSREKAFLDNLMDIIPTGDMGLFVDHVYNFDNVVGLESWHLKLLNRVKEDLEEEKGRLAGIEAAKARAKKQAMEERQAKFRDDYRAKER